MVDGERMEAARRALVSGFLRADGDEIAKEVDAG
jgi:hypothetical protein